MASEPNTESARDDPYPCLTSEVILDVGVRLKSSWDARSLQSLQSWIAGDYPTREDDRGKVRVLEDARTLAEKDSWQLSGATFRSQDGRRTVQARHDGLTFSRLKPCGPWPSFHEEARRAWDAYREAVALEVVTRLSLRRVNRIDLPEVTQLRDYVATVPEIAPGLPQGLAEFFMQVVIPLGSFGCTAIVTETVEEAENGRRPLLFDVDVFVEQPFAPDAAEIWSTFERLRAAGDEVVRRSLTTKAAELVR